VLFGPPMDAGALRDSLQQYLKYFGAATTALYGYRLLRFIATYLRSSKLDRYHHGERGSTWALVTGASDGIGHGFANALLDAGFNVLLHGRNAQKLANLQSSLQKNYPSRQIRYVIADAGIPSPAINDVVDAAQSLPGKLTILINNVGGTPGGPTYCPAFERTEDNILTLMHVNAGFPTRLTRALVPLLASNGPSLIMNIGSVAGLIGFPYISVYSACKAFNNIFSKALAQEVQAEGLNVEVLGILVGNVLSAGNTSVMPGFTPTSREFAGYALDRVGCGERLVWAWYRHAIQNWLVTSMPTSFAENFTIGEMQKRRKIELKGE